MDKNEISPFPLEEDKEREVSLFYFGMTRAKEFLCMSYSGESEFTNYLDRILLERNQKKSGLVEIK
jgi:superfamily I DNA/RNA helicase